MGDNIYKVITHVNKGTFNISSRIDVSQIHQSKIKVDALLEFHTIKMLEDLGRGLNTHNLLKFQTKLMDAQPVIEKTATIVAFHPDKFAQVLQDVMEATRVSLGSQRKTREFTDLKNAIRWQFR